jgi:hypothetical protein
MSFIELADSQLASMDGPTRLRYYIKGIKFALKIVDPVAKDLLLRSVVDSADDFAMGDSVAAAPLVTSAFFQNVHRLLNPVCEPEAEVVTKKADEEVTSKLLSSSVDKNASLEVRALQAFVAKHSTAGELTSPFEDGFDTVLRLMTGRIGFQTLTAGDMTSACRHFKALSSVVATKVTGVRVMCGCHTLIWWLSRVSGARSIGCVVPCYVA